MPMESALTDEQLLFHQTTVRFIEAELPLARTRDLHEHAVGFERSWLQKAAAIGWFAMLVPESDGGGSVSGDGLVDAVLVAEELGRNVQPGPFIPMNVVARSLSRAGSARHVTRAIVAGDAVATWAYAGARGEWDGGAGLVAERTGDGVRLTGTRGCVQDAAAADWILAAATLDGAPVLVLVPAGADSVRVRPLSALDLSHRFGDVQFDGVTVADDAVLDSGNVTLEAALQHAVVLSCAEMVGATDALFSMTVAYAKERVAFGRPIGSFQALKHVMADQALWVEACKAAALAAAWAVQHDDADAPEVVSMAAAYIGDVANEVAQDCLQIHGGIGYTWEHDLHLLLRRIRSNSALYGEPTWHRERVCALHGLAR